MGKTTVTLLHFRFSEVEITTCEAENYELRTTKLQVRLFNTPSCLLFGKSSYSVV